MPETTTSSGGVRHTPGRLVAFVRSWRPAHYALLLLVHVQLFASGGRAGDVDWYEFIYPWADALRDTILKYHQFPWWNPWSISGQPFFAEPQTAVLMPDTLFLAIFGAVVGYKVVILFYAAVGYEGSRFLCRHLYGRSSFVDGVSVIPALLPPLALHLGVGHAVLVSFWLFPWLLGLALTWHESATRSLAFGAIVGSYFLTYLHYSIIIGFTMAGLIVLVQLGRSFRSRDLWMKAALVASTALGIGLTRIVLAASFISGFPRMETKHYPIVASISQIVQTLVDPFQSSSWHGDVAGLGWWELGSYVGLPVLLLAYEGFRGGDRRLRPLHFAAIVCLVLAWNNRDMFLPGYWLHVIPPWKSMVIITRWRLFACYFLLLGAVQGLVAIRANGRAKLAVGLAALVVLDLGFNIYYAYRGTFERLPPPFQAAPDPPRTIQRSPRRRLARLPLESCVDGFGVSAARLARSLPEARSPRNSRLSRRLHRNEAGAGRALDPQPDPPQRLPRRHAHDQRQSFQLLAHERPASVPDRPGHGAGEAVHDSRPAGRAGRAGCKAPALGDAASFPGTFGAGGGPAVQANPAGSQLSSQLFSRPGWWFPL